MLVNIDTYSDTHTHTLPTNIGSFTISGDDESEEEPLAVDRNSMADATDRHTYTHTQTHVVVLLTTA